MVNRSYQHKMFALTYLNTYGVAGTVTKTDVKDETRIRQWERAFPSKLAAYKSLAKNGFLPTTPYRDDLFVAINSQAVECEGQMYSDPRSTFQHVFVPLTPRYSVDPTTDATVAALVAGVQADLQSNISGHGASVPMSLMEAGSTIGMITSAAQRLKKAYDDVRRLRFRAAAKRLGLPTSPRGVSRSKSVSDNWLEYRYGWRLVMYDVQSYLKTLFDILHRPIVYRVSSVRRSTADYQTITTGQSITLPFTSLRSIVYDEQRDANIFAEVTGGYVYELSCPGLATAESFGLLNPFGVLWDAIPFSFVADWFVNVGDCLAGLTAFAGKKQLDGWICRMIQSTRVYRWKNVRKGEVFSLSRIPRFTSGPVIERRFQRSWMAFTSSSLRYFNDLNLPRLVDAVSLLSGIGKSPTRAIANVF